jgi:hypothetical protein
MKEDQRIIIIKYIFLNIFYFWKFDNLIENIFTILYNIFNIFMELAKKIFTILTWPNQS